MKTVIVGIGGVGGVIGGFMAKNRPPEDEVVFVARPGGNFDALSERGVALRTEFAGDFTARPTLVVDDIACAGGEADLVVVCVKAYSLDDVAARLAPVVGDRTVVVPILNGVDTAARISRLLGRGVVLDGCTYITGVTLEPGVVSHPGASRKILCGGPGDPALIARAAKKMVDSEIDAEVRDDIQVAVWTKYLMLCSFGVGAAYFDANVGEMLADGEKLATLRRVLGEIRLVAEKKNVGLPDDCVERCLAAARELNPGNTSSLKRDLDKNDGSPCELALFSPYICRLGEELGVDTPANRMIADALTARWRDAGGR